MTDQTPTPNSPAAPAAQPVPAASAPSLLGAQSPTPSAPTGGGPQMPDGYEGGADAWGKLDEAGKGAAVAAAGERAKADSAARVDAWSKAGDKAAKITAWQALSKDERAEAFKGMDDAAKAELGLKSASTPVYGEFKLPEGYAVDEKAMGEFAGLAKEAGLDQAQAQKFIDMASQREIAAANKGVQAFVDLQTKWHGEVMSDPEIGGAKWDATKASIDRLMDRLAIPGLREAMNLTGAGNNPAIVRSYARLAAMVAEDRLLNGAHAPSADRDRAPNYYGEGPKGSTV